MQVSSYSSGVETVQSFRDRLADYLKQREAGDTELLVGVQDQASKYIPGTDIPSAALDGVYGDPKLARQASSVSSDLAERVTSALKDIRTNELGDMLAEQRASLEEELGRKLGSDESYYTIGDRERDMLSADFKRRENEIGSVNLSIGLASSTPEESARSITLLSPGSQYQTVSLDVSTDEGQAAAVNKKLTDLVEFNIRGVESLFSIAKDQDHFGSELAQKALEDIGDVDLEELKKSLYALHKERFESGELELTYRGHALTPPANE